ncbi:MAG: hypothetical protein KAX57_02140 [Rhodoferax sp.]|nr:hypothetical protein [Rhodoferax sp.]
MANHNEIVKEQLLHMVFGTVVFIVLAAFAVGLDVAAAGLTRLNVSDFTHKALELTAHGMLVVDLVLFVTYVGTSSFRLFKEMFK